MPMFSAQHIFVFCKELLQGAGVLDEDAAVAANVLVDASMEGIDTHGISRLPIYLRSMQNGRINPRPTIKVNRTAPSLANVDGDNGLGQLVAVQSMRIAIDLAGETGIGAVAAKHSNHYGASSYYCKMASASGKIGMAFTNTPSGIPPWGGKKAYFGTNPIAFAFPGRDQPVVIDMSSSIVARGNIIMAAKEGKPIQEGWAIDSKGLPTTDAKAALDGAVLPMAGPKGYAMALAVEILAGILSGSAYGPRVGWIYDQSTRPVDIGHFFIAIDIGRMMNLSDFFSRLDHMVGEIKSSPKAAGVEAIYIPGERRTLIKGKRKTAGIPVSDQLLSELNGLARDLGVHPLAE